MLLYLFLLMTLVPLAELALLIWIGRETTWWFPFLLTMTTGLLGAMLARWQGFMTLTRIRADVDAGRTPASAMVDGLLILLAGLLLVTPGVMTDVVGFALLVPPLRTLMKRATRAWLQRNFQQRSGEFRETASGTTDDRDRIVDVRVIESRVEEP